MQSHRSFCPLNLIVEIIGDKWSLLILRDMMFENKRNFRQLLQSEEGIASNILTDRMNKLEREGLVTKKPAPGHMQKITYSLTEKSIDMMPLLIEAMRWSIRYEAVERTKYKSAVELVLAGPDGQLAFARKLMAEHVSVPD